MFPRLDMGADGGGVSSQAGRNRLGEQRNSKEENRWQQLHQRNLANAIVKLVAADALPALMGNLVMGNLVNRDYEATLAQAGDTVNVPIPPVLVANNLVEGGTVQAQNPNVGNAQIVLNTHAEATFQIPDVTKVIAVPDLLKLYMQPAVVALAERIETDLLNLYSQFTANSPLGVPGTSISESMIDQAETALFSAKVPASAPKYLVVDAKLLFATAADRPFQRVQHRRRSRAADPDRWRGRQDEGLLHLPFAVRGQDRHAGDGSQPRFQPGCDRPSGSPAAATPCRGRCAIAEYAEMGNFGVRVTHELSARNTLAQQFTVDVLYGCGVLRNTFGIQINA